MKKLGIELLDCCISPHQSLNVLFYSLSQSISAPGSGIWSDGKDKNDGSQAHTWNVEVLIDVVKEVVSDQFLSCSIMNMYSQLNIYI